MLASNENGRLTRIAALRDRHHLKFREIGVDMGFSTSRARMLYKTAIRFLEESMKPKVSAVDPYAGLPERVRNVCEKLRLKNRAEILAAVKSGKLHPRNPKCRSFGTKSFYDVCAWLGLPTPERPAKTTRYVPAV